MGIMLAVLAISAGEPARNGSASPETVVSVTIIYDNYQVEERLKTDWGLLQKPKKEASWLQDVAIRVR